MRASRLMPCYACCRSGAGKTTILRTVAGLWSHGSGSVVRHGQPMGQEEGQVRGGKRVPGPVAAALGHAGPCCIGM